MHILLVGCGKMGGAMLRGWLRQRTASSIVIINPSRPSEELLNHLHFTWHDSPGKIPATYEPTIIVLAVKPQKMAEVLPNYARFKNSLFVSVAAGKRLATLAAGLGESKAIVRVMPNTPASIGEGMSVAVTNRNVSGTQRDLCDSLLRACGQVAWVDNESMLDPVTALSGCGPAYVFALTEAMADAGKSLGLPAELAETLARQTIIGAGALLANTSEKPEALIKNVASPGGSTEAALKHLLGEKGIGDLMTRAMTAASARSKEIAS